MSFQDGKPSAPQEGEALFVPKGRQIVASDFSHLRLLLERRRPPRSTSSEPWNANVLPCRLLSSPGTPSPPSFNSVPALERRRPRRSTVFQSWNVVVAVIQRISSTGTPSVASFNGFPALERRRQSRPMVFQSWNVVVAVIQRFSSPGTPSLGSLNVFPVLERRRSACSTFFQSWEVLDPLDPPISTQNLNFFCRSCKQIGGKIRQSK